MWRLVAAGYGTLTEIESGWTMLDVWSAHQVLDLNEDLDVLANSG